jgi:two-component system, chemotaxis family, chemotaxis protein CheY
MKKVLVVDDAVTVRMYHRGILEGVGLEVREAANGYEGLEKALQERFGLFLVDVNMPKMDGYAMVRKLREQEEHRAAPVVMISTEAEQQDRDKAYAAGANFYLTKPARPDELITTVSMLAGITRR